MAKGPPPEYDETRSWLGLLTPGGCLAGVILGAALGASIGLGGPALGIFGLLFGALCAALLVKLNSDIAKERKAAIEAWYERERRNKVCPHGVRGGETVGLCAECLSEKAAAERAAEIAAKAQRLAEEERQRLSKALMRDAGKLRSVPPEAFEKAVAAMYRALGFKVEETPLTGDAGVDLWVVKGGVKYGVQCKRYGQQTKVGRPELQMLVGAISGLARGGVLVTTGQFTKEALSYAQRQAKLQLVDSAQLATMMRQAFPDVDGTGPVRVMCKVCGEVIELPLSAGKITAGTCSSGHLVCNWLTVDTLAQGLREKPRRGLGLDSL